MKAHGRKLGRKLPILCASPAVFQEWLIAELDIIDITDTGYRL